MDNATQQALQLQTQPTGLPVQSQVDPAVAEQYLKSMTAQTEQQISDFAGYKKQIEPAMQESIKANETQGQQLTKAIEQARTSASASHEQEQKEIGSLQQPETPNFKFTPPEMKGITTFTSMLMVIGALSGRSTMHPMTAAMNNMSGVMKGIQTGNEELYNRSKQEFDTNLKAGMDAFNVYNDKVNMIQAKYKGDMALQDKELNFAQLEAGIHPEIAKNKVDMINSMQKIKQDYYAKAGQFELALAKAAAAKGFGNGEASPAIKGAMAAGMPPIAGFGQATQMKMKAFTDAAHDIAVKEGISEEDAGRELFQREIQAKGAAGAYAATAKLGAGVEYSAIKIEKDTQLMESIFKQVEAADAQRSEKWMNKPLNALKYQMSDPLLGNLDLVTTQLGLEYERAMMQGQMSVAQLHTGAAEDAKRLYNRDMSLEEMRSKVPTMLKEIGNARTARTETGQEILQGLPGGSAPSQPKTVDFNSLP